MSNRLKFLEEHLNGSRPSFVATELSNGTYELVTGGNDRNFKTIKKLENYLTEKNSDYLLIIDDMIK